MHPQTMREATRALALVLHTGIAKRESIRQAVSQSALLDRMVLFVEDDLLVHDMAGPALEACGPKLMLAADADEALVVPGENQYSGLVFSDIAMAGKLSGIDLAESASKFYPEIPAVLVAGYADRRVTLPGCEC